MSVENKMLYTIKELVEIKRKELAEIRRKNDQN